jgi:hypothetical protein
MFRVLGSKVQGSGSDVLSSELRGSMVGKSKLSIEYKPFIMQMELMASQRLVIFLVVFQP